MSSQLLEEKSAIAHSYVPKAMSDDKPLRIFAFDVEYFEATSSQFVSYGEAFSVQGTISWQF